MAINKANNKNLGEKKISMKELKDLLKERGLEDVSYETIYERIVRGEDIESAISRPVTRKSKKANQIDPKRWGLVIDPESPNIIHPAHGSKLKASRGYYEEEVRGYYVDPEGNKFPSIRQMCYAHGIDESTARLRIRAGATLEHALTPGRMALKKQGVTDEKLYGYDGRRKKYSIGDGNYFPTIKELAKNYKVPVEYYRYICEHGYDKIENMTNHAPFPSAAEPLEIGGKQYKDFRSLYKDFHISSKGIYSDMILRGKTLEEIVLSKEKDDRKDYTTDFKDPKFGYSFSTKDWHVRGEEEHYKSFSAMCKAHGMAYVSVARRVNKGMKLAHAINEAKAVAAQREI